MLDNQTKPEAVTGSEKLTEAVTGNSELAAKPAPLCWTIDQAAERLNLATITVRRLILRGKLRKIEGIRKVLVPEASLREFAA